MGGEGPMGSAVNADGERHLRHSDLTRAAQSGAVTNGAYLRARWPDVTPAILKAVLGLLEG